MVSGINKVVNASFVRRFAGASQGEGSATVSAGAAAKTTLSKGLRFGAQTYASAIQNLNATISFVNVSQSTLKKLTDLTDRMLTYAESAADSASSEDSRRKSSAAYRKLVTQFRDVVEGAKLGDTELLTLDGLNDLLSRAGLSQDSSESIKAVFREFVYPRTDETFASEKQKGKRPIDLPISAGFIPFYDDPAKILDGDIRTRANAYRAVTDLKALKSQMKKNSAALEDVRTVISDNISMVRVAGLAMLEISNQLSNETDAEKLAQAVQQEILRTGGGHLSEAENLDDIAAATLALLQSS